MGFFDNFFKILNVLQNFVKKSGFFWEKIGFLKKFEKTGGGKMQERVAVKCGNL